MTLSWTERIQMMDAKAEEQHERLSMVVDEIRTGEEIVVVAQALRAIAAEMRAARVQLRPLSATEPKR